MTDSLSVELQRGLIIHTAATISESGKGNPVGNNFRILVFIYTMIFIKQLA